MSGQSRANRAIEGPAANMPDLFLHGAGKRDDLYRDADEILLRERQLVRVSEELVFHRSAIDQLRNMMAARKSERFNVTVFKEWTGVSRKYAIPLLEYLDRQRVTRREGDKRVIL